MNKFPCTQCGACCRRISRAIEFVKTMSPEKQKMFAFPYTHTDGICDMLVDNKCSVYEDRPLLCNIERVARVLDLSMNMFQRANIEACNKMMDEDNMPEHYRIKQDEN